MTDHLDPTGRVKPVTGALHGLHAADPVGSAGPAPFRASGPAAYMTDHVPTEDGGLATAP